jgi:2-C-methyl-D-erythritol 4-phosphate cytidylyltransferase
MNILAIIVAAGQGVRMGAGRPKAFLRLGGLTLLERSLAPFLTHPRVDRVVAAVPDPEEAGPLLGPSAAKVVLVRGGATRQDSVRCALLAAPPGADEIILVHDAARPLVTRAIIDAVIASARVSGASIPAVAPPDTIKQIDGDGAVVATLPRDRLRLAQTPQGFRGDLLRDAYARAERDGVTGTDDAALVERTGHKVAVVEGSPRNIKITSPGDLALAEAILASETRTGPRGGHDG